MFSLSTYIQVTPTTHPHFFLNVIFPSIISGNRREVEPVYAQLAKEIQLKHRAPVVSINIIDASFAAVGESFEYAGSKPVSESSPPHRVVISSEEQFKVIATGKAKRLELFLNLVFILGFYASKFATVWKVQINGLHRL